VAFAALRCFASFCAGVLAAERSIGIKMTAMANNFIRIALLQYSFAIPN
jgi:hypothetical protein